MKFMLREFLKVMFSRVLLQILNSNVLWGIIFNDFFTCFSKRVILQAYCSIEVSMQNCWANGFSDCSSKISKEHLISSGIFEQQKISVSGFPWCKGEPKEVSIASLTSKILCTKHNNGLSNIDREGINAIRIFESLLPSNMKRVKTLPQVNKINGLLFERWLLKTAVNLSFKSNFHIGSSMSDSLKGKPSPYILAVIFGELNLSHQMGLYLIPNITPLKYQIGQILVIPIHKNSEIAGFFFHIRGFNFFLSLYPGHAAPPLREMGLQESSFFPSELLDSSPIYRWPILDIADENTEVKKVVFMW